MNRQNLIEKIEENKRWDMIVIGGGATGLGVAVDSASRGFRTLLLEADDFSKGTSSRSTKLVHGGVRYLEQGDIPLVLEALRERGLMHNNAPHLVHHLSFIVPRYQWWEGPFFGIGLKVYDALAGKLNLAPSRLVSREETIARIPNIEQENLLGGVEYF
ncbi:MAG: FAD-dependent oxidoreductase, partial [Verrucomicrobiota bacterium]